VPFCQNLAPNCGIRVKTPLATSRADEVGSSGSIIQERLMLFESYCPRSVFQGSGRSSLGRGEALGDGLAIAHWITDQTEQLSYVFHNHLKLSLSLSGTGSVWRHGAGQRNATTLSFCIAPPGLTTDWQISSRAEAFHLYIHQSALHRAIVNGLGRDPAQVEIPERIFFEDDHLYRHIHSTFLHTDWREPANRLALTSAAYCTLDHLLARHSTVTSTNPVKGGLTPSTLRRVDEFVRSHLAQPLSISDIASITGLSEFHFARMFKKSTGESPHSYVLRRRADFAKQLLVSSRMALVEIAKVCGYSSQSHFVAQFRSFTSVTPRRYRALHPRRQ
jgi:AraC family transcriptional regulator